MSLADRDVQLLLNRSFVATWGNVAGDPTAGSSYAHDPQSEPGSCIRGNGEHNIQILTLTPAGEMLGVTAGFLSGDELREELAAMLELHDALAKATERQGLSRDQRRQLVADAHDRQLRQLEERVFEGPLADWARKRALADHRFARRRPLLHHTGFRPTDLVGNARTFFGSSSNGTPTGRIGEAPELDPDKLLEQLRREAGGAPRTGGR